MVGYLAIADEVLPACDLVREHRGDQVFGAHSLQRRRDLLAAAKARQRERGTRDPAPARGEHRRIEHRLDEHVAHRARAQVARDGGELEAVARGKRKHDRVLGRGRLQLEVELPAEALAQREPPRPIETASERRVDDELHAAGFVEEPLENDRRLRGHRAERRAAGREVLDELRRRIGGDAGRFAQAGDHGGCVARVVDPRGDFRAQPRHRARQLVGPPRRFAEPEGNRRRLAVRVFDPHAARFDAPDLVRRIAQLEDVAGEALDGEILVDGADDHVGGLQHDLVVRGVGDRAAGRERGETRAAASAQHAVHRVAVDVGCAVSAARREAVGQHPHDVEKLLAREIRIRVRATHEIVEIAFGPFGRRDLGDDLLREHVERLFWNRQPVELATGNGIEQRRALDELVAREREEPRLRYPADLVARASRALQERRDRARRSELAHEVDVADVDAELERGGGDEDLELAVLQPLLGLQPQLLRHAAVMRHHAIGAQELGQVPRRALRHPARVDENERRAMALRERRELRIDLFPDLVRHHRFERRGGDGEREIARPDVTGVDDRALARLRLRARNPRRRPGSARSRRSAFASPKARSARAACPSARRAARATTRGGCRACCRRAHGSRRRSRSGSSRASCGPIPSRAARRAIRVS